MRDHWWPAIRSRATVLLVQVTSTDTNRSPAAQARRSQIVAATIEVIAESGFAKASFARIAEHAQLSSTRLISYHFADKQALVAAVTDEVVGLMGAHLWRRVSSAATARDRLQAYILGVVEFTGARRSEMRALTEIFLAGGMDYGPADETAVVGHVEAILRNGQATGEFRDFDPVVMATAVQRAVEGLPFLLAARPELDVAAYGRELVTLFDLGTRSSRP